MPCPRYDQVRWSLWVTTELRYSNPSAILRPCEYYACAEDTSATSPGTGPIRTAYLVDEVLLRCVILPVTRPLARATGYEAKLVYAVNVPWHICSISITFSLVTASPSPVTRHLARLRMVTTRICTRHQRGVYGSSRA